MNNLLLPTLVFALVTLSACGQKGNLYLPEQPASVDSETTEPKTEVEPLQNSEDLAPASRESNL